MTRTLNDWLDYQLQIHPKSIDMGLERISVVAKRLGIEKLAGRSVSPHTLRHTCALDTLRATGDLRKVSLWLGHANQSTTEIYLQTDPTEKIEIIESTVPLRLRPGRFRPPDRLIASLMRGKTQPPRE